MFFICCAGALAVTSHNTRDADTHGRYRACNLQEYTAYTQLSRHARVRACMCAGVRARLSLSHSLSVISSSLSERRLREYLSAPLEYLGSLSLEVSVSNPPPPFRLSRSLSPQHEPCRSGAARPQSQRTMRMSYFAMERPAQPLLPGLPRHHARTSIEEEDCDEEAHGLGLLDRLPQRF